MSEVKLETAIHGTAHAVLHSPDNFKDKDAGEKIKTQWRLKQRA